MKWLLENRSESCTKETLAIAAQNSQFEVVLFLYAKLGPDCVPSNVVVFGDAWIAHMEIVQWLYDKNPLSVKLDTLVGNASYIPAVLEHILELPPGLGSDRER